MKSTQYLSKACSGALIVVLLLLTGCNPTAASTIAPTSTVSPTFNPSGLTSDEAATLGSLEKVLDYPFYVMHYQGPYQYPRIGSSAPAESVYSCSLFAALNPSVDMYYGRNFDWEFSPALLLYTDPPDGYASVSMVDLTFLGISAAQSARMADLPLAERAALLAAPSMPFDGMNEYGLTIGMAALPDEFIDDASYDASRPGIGSVGIIRQLLDHARDVDEALEIFKSYNIDFSGGPPIHYLLADPGGHAALIEFYQGKMVVLPNTSPWHMATNYMVSLASGDGGCPRYHILSDRLTLLDGLLDPLSAMQLLADVSQDITQWSSVYDMTSGDIHIAIGKDYTQTLTYHLDLLSP